MGMRQLRTAGAFTIAQDQATSAVYGMPKAAAQMNAAVRILPLKQIAPALVEHFSDPRRLKPLASGEKRN
jgi:chemotaxis response regulator CheB